MTKGRIGLFVMPAAAPRGFSEAVFVTVHGQDVNMMGCTAYSRTWAR